MYGPRPIQVWKKAHHVGFEGGALVPIVRFVAFALLLMLLGASAQFQPTAPDFSSFESREDIATAGDLAGALRVMRFVQVSDAHILDDDAPAPMRVDALDAVFFATGVSDGARRPQEEYTDESLDAMIRAINAIHALDPLDFVLNTGDNTDNSLENELMRFIDNWEGTHTTAGPISQIACQPDGQSSSATDDSNDVTDACTSLPTVVAQNNTPLIEGLPWFSAFGNHDGLIQGNVPIEPSFQDIAGQFGRRFLQQTEFVRMHFEGSISCESNKPRGSVADDFGHGFGFAGDRLCDEDPDNDGYYSFGSRGLRFIVLDTVNDDFVTSNENWVGGFSPQATLGNDLVGGYAEGSIDAAQYTWLVAELERHKDELVVLMSHHTVNSMFSKHVEGNCGGPNGECLDDLLVAAGYKTGPMLAELLAGYPNVIAWIGGHLHINQIQPKSIAGAPSAGFWNIDTSSVIDMPQEARIIEVWVTADGSKGFLTLLPFTHDFALSRELAMTDEQFDVEKATGTSKDRQALLWFDIPAAVRLVPQTSLPHALRVEPTAPARINGTHGLVGEPLTAALRITDQVTGLPVAGLQVKVAITHTDPAGGPPIHVFNGSVDDHGDGNYSFTFTPQAPRVHYLAYSITDPVAGYPRIDRVVSLDIMAEEPEATPGKKSPGVAAPLLLLALLGLAARRR